MKHALRAWKRKEKNKKRKKKNIIQTLRGLHSVSWGTTRPESTKNVFISLERRWNKTKRRCCHNKQERATADVHATSPLKGVRIFEMLRVTRHEKARESSVKPIFIRVTFLLVIIITSFFGFLSLFCRVSDIGFYIHYLYITFLGLLLSLGYWIEHGAVLFFSGRSRSLVCHDNIHSRIISLYEVITNQCSKNTKNAHKKANKKHKLITQPTIAIRIHLPAIGICAKNKRKSIFPRMESNASTDIIYCSSPWPLCLSEEEKNYA